ncbi:lycopene cyclase [Flavobacterium sp. J49]|uniref:lycopene cyclase family protein n=1 Tax=Flavobacterium sp. J49 TaxID=2718534 RepID=UPI00159450D5|nr:lycopene cyclase family protein [Flavobacterium sp. J49]MBF6641551.1 lycopene cyclase [Flavobacterium sp. J49]NIC02798.1 lycopene cyclase [Flavobacterium sp. J49]
MKHYHYIFTGAGLSALMTVYEMVLSGKFKDKSILLIDENSKKTNDRTWCFWDDKGLYDDMASAKWQSAWFKNKVFERQLNLSPYQYKMVKGLDFYNKVFKLISKEENITFLNQKVLDFQELGHHCVVKTVEESFTCNQIFNSIFNPEVVKNQTKYPFLHQHFIGWFIQSKEPVFHPDCATFMDFSVEQKGNTRFMYVLPTSQTEALLEYTLFSKDLLPVAEYETEIKNYINKLGITSYELLEKEQGNIPMTCYPFWQHNSKNILNIGSAGGWTKASTGYTFKNTTKKSKALVQFLSKENDLTKFHKADKFWFYDLLLLDILDQKNHLGSTIFSAMFEKGNTTVIFKFLDEETSFWEDLQVIWKCPKMLFIKALFGRIF